MTSEAHRRAKPECQLRDTGASQSSLHVGHSQVYDFVFPGKRHMSRDQSQLNRIDALPDRLDERRAGERHEQRQLSAHAAGLSQRWLRTNRMNVQLGTVLLRGANRLASSPAIA